MVDFNFDWLIEMFGNFYDFFGGISYFFNLTPRWIVNSFESSAQNLVSYVFYNPFFQNSSIKEVYMPTAVIFVFRWLNDNGWSMVPVWAIILQNMVILFLIVMSIRFIAALKDMIWG